MSEIELVTTPSLGDSSYVLISGDEVALVDPQRDAWRVLPGLASRRLTVRYVLESHVHNDYVSGALEVRAATGAQVVAAERGGYQFDHRGVGEGDEIPLGDVVVRVIETPGHTPEHVSFLVFEAQRAAPVAAFTGGSLIAGSAGRTDLLGEEFTGELTQAQFQTLHRLALLPAGTAVLPTHGAGSFCASNVTAGDPTSTIGHERRTNPALLAIDEETFVREQLSGLPRYPTYYRYLATVNRAGPRVLRHAPALP